MYNFHKCINSCIEKEDLESLKLFVELLLAERLSSMADYKELVFCNVVKSDDFIAKTLAIDAQDIVYCVKTLEAIPEGDWDTIRKLFSQWDVDVASRIVEEV